MVIPMKLARPRRVRAALRRARSGRGDARVDARDSLRAHAAAVLLRDRGRALRLRPAGVPARDGRAASRAARRSGARAGRCTTPARRAGLAHAGLRRSSRAAPCCARRSRSTRSSFPRSARAASSNGDFAHGERPSPASAATCSASPLHLARRASCRRRRAITGTGTRATTIREHLLLDAWATARERVTLPRAWWRSRSARSPWPRPSSLRAATCEPRAALLAATLVALLPDMLAHAGIAYNDVPLAFAVLAGIYALDAMVREPTPRRVAIAALAFALAARDQVQRARPAPGRGCAARARGDRAARRSPVGVAVLRAGARILRWSVYASLVLIYPGDWRLADYMQRTRGALELGAGAEPYGVPPGRASRSAAGGTSSPWPSR